MTREKDLARRSAEIRKFFRSTPSDKTTVSQFLHDVELEMKEYRAEVNRLKTTIYTIESKHDMLQKTAELYKTLFSPIHAVPSEVLTMIFAFLCEENVVSRSTLPEVLRISMVCGRWRDIIYSTPSLWTGIKIDFCTWSKDFDVLHELTEHFLKWSGKSALRLFLEFPDDDFGEGSAWKEAHSSLNALVASCERWEALSLTLTPPQFPTTIFDAIRGRLPALTSLALIQEGDLKIELPFNYFDGCPALCSLDITLSLVDPRQEALPLPWSQIKHLQMSTAYNLRAFLWLSFFPAVENLEVHEIGGLDEGQDYADHVILSGIKTLTIASATEQDEVDGVLQHTTLSGILSLKIWGYWYRLREEWPVWTETHLRNFLQRSSCNITTLDLSHLPITDEQMLSLLGIMPTVKSLRIEELRDEGENRIVTKLFLDGLAIQASMKTPSSAPLVPCLADMKLIIHAENLHSDPFLRTLSSRWLPDPHVAAEIGVDCLRFVAIVVVLGSDEKGGHLNDLFCFKDAGMQLSITYGARSELYFDNDDESEGGGDGENGEEGSGEESS
ncbi:hypothetical protein V5O48_011882 [Marasmius crinis-equi]|uniref:F-box domain-containing protein n=1 Tax=Marasmius crinis-equi TaxID=585013 RepID=A0ABR3F4B1_9AGAR